MYIIGIFLATNEVEVIPEEWLSDPLTSIKNSTQCWWPPYKSSSRTSKAVTSREQVDKGTWAEYSIKVLGRYDSFDDARRKLPKATDTSNLESDDEFVPRKRKRQRNKLFMEDEITSEEDFNEETVLPLPPKYKKAPNKNNTAMEETPTSQTLCQDRSSPANISVNCSSPRTTTTEQNQNLPSRNDMMLLRRDVLDIKLKMNRMLEAFDDLKDKILNSTSENIEINPADEAIIEISNKFPLTEEDVDVVENMLEDRKMKKNLITYLKKYGGCNIKTATFTLLRAIFSDDTGAKYSWLGAKKKKVFSSLRIFEAMADAIRERFKDATIEDISVYVKTWLRNAPMRIQLKLNRKTQ